MPLIYSILTGKYVERPEPVQRPAPVAAPTPAPASAPQRPRSYRLTDIERGPDGRISGGRLVEEFST